MIHSSRHYAEALFEALDGKTGASRQHVLEEFITMIHKNHQSHSLNQILVHYEKVFLKKNGLRKVDVESASPLSSKLRKEIENAVGGDILLTETTKPELLAGMTILLDDSQYIDASAKTKINNLFR